MKPLMLINNHGVLTWVGNLLGLKKPSPVDETERFNF